MDGCFKDSACKAGSQFQVRAIRILGEVEGNKLQTLGHRRGVAAVAVMHRLLSKRAPFPLHSLIPDPIPERKRVSKRSLIPPVLLVPKKGSQEFYSNSFLPTFTRVWNDIITPTVRMIRDPQHFKKRINSDFDFTILV